MAKLIDFTIGIKVDITLWQAIKLRIAGAESRKRLLEIIAQGD